MTRICKSFFLYLAAGACFFLPKMTAAQISGGPNVNVSKRSGNEAEPSIAIDPADPTRLVITSNINTTGLLESVSTDGGATWTTGEIADNTDNLSPACCDSTVAFDAFSNLWMGYLGKDVRVKVALSTDGGWTWANYADLGPGDEPTVTAGSNSVWVTFHDGTGHITAAGAAVTGAGSAGPFNMVETAPGSADGHYGDITLGPQGEVLVTYQVPSSGQGPGDIYVNLDPDGLGPAHFQNAVHVTSTNVGGFDYIPAQASRSVDAEAGIVWDHSGGLYDGRIYLVYTGESPNESNNMDILLRYSDNNGSTWSDPVRVNDDSTTTSQFLSHVALDQSTGDLAVSWYDCRNDTGSGAGDTNGIPDDDAEMYASISNDGGVSFYPAFQVSPSPSNSADSVGRYDYGDYDGLAFQNGSFYPVWADNSNSTGDNTDGLLSKLEIYTDHMMDTTAGPQLGLTPSHLPDGVLNFFYDQDIVAHGGTSPYTFSQSGTIPAGLTLNCSTASCTLTGTPSSSGLFSFSISVSDSASHSGIRNYTLNIAPSCIFCDDFEDGVPDPAWTYLKPAWTESGGMLNGSPAGRKASVVASPAFSGCTECSVETMVQTSGGSSGKVWVLAWYQSSKNDVELLMRQDSNKWILRQRVNGVIASKSKAISPIVANTAYDVKISFDGSSLTLTVDGSPLIVLPIAAVPFGTVGFQAKDTTASFGFILVN